MGQPTISRKLSRILLCTALSALAILSRSRTASADAAVEISSVLTIEKSSNRNQVDYALQVDDGCAPTGAAPVHPYWRMLERGEFATEALTDREASFLGVLRQNVLGHRVEVALRGFPDRTLIIQTQRGADGRCSSQATTTIAGVEARIANVFVKQELFGRVGFVLLTGRADDGSLVRERIVP